MSEGDVLLAEQFDNGIELTHKAPVYNSVYYLVMTVIDSSIMYFFYKPIDENAPDYEPELVHRMALHSSLFAASMVCSVLVHYCSKLVIKRTQDAGYFRFSALYEFATEAYLELSFLLFIVFVILIGRLKDSEDDSEDYEHIEDVIISQRVALVLQLSFSALAFVFYCVMDVYWWRFEPKIDIFDDLTFNPHLPFLSLLQQSNKIDVFYSNQANVNAKIQKFGHLSASDATDAVTEGAKKEMLLIRDEVDQLRLNDALLNAKIKNMRMAIEEQQKLKEELGA